ncbi:Type II secretion system protein [Rhodovastum atsumiense]|uniref:Type II secretion system protein n=1 Tax=Rhodovastum atsumiense TaxID=504468 RepID=A0A5M6IZJ1_9PROT|nr:type II secretion system protein [Rhodovastum atsumiense]KAA5612768.1 type II secretion system protein [Rhodovastum atsumiense]CAH2602668.1 Type II secretion system protein [Rhodovastum atsumiense]
MRSLLDIARSGLRPNRAMLRKVNALRRRAGQSGFTLLELLVVVAILAAIAGTATIVLQDTDRRASAAAHVVIMDELKKGVNTFQVLNGGQLPNNWDSLLQTETAVTEGETATPSQLLSIMDDALRDGGDTSTTSSAFLKMIGLPAGVTEELNTAGITKMRVVQNAAVTPKDAKVDCSDLKRLINDTRDSTVASNIYMAPSSHGCGATYTLADGGNVAVWVGGQKRIFGSEAIELGGNEDTTTTTYGGVIAANGTAPGQRLLMAVGFGPDTTIFNGKIGGLTTVPVYRHVAKDDYNRFIGLIEIANTPETGTTSGTTTTYEWQAITPSLVAVVDGAGDTKDEELGEWDGTRSSL